MARYDDLNTSTLGYLTFMSVILLIVTVLLLQALCYNWIDWQEDGKLLKQSYIQSDAILEAQKTSLTKYEKAEVEVPIKLPPGAPKDAPATEKQNRNYIPVERAEAILLEQIKAKGKPAPST